MAAMVTSHCNVVPTFSVLFSFSHFDTRFISGLVPIHCEVIRGDYRISYDYNYTFNHERMALPLNCQNCYYGNERQSVALSSLADGN